jgi:hypothetical protein
MSSYENARSFSEKKTTPLASDTARNLQNTWKHGHPETRAVIWTKGNEGGKGVRHEGSHVSPSENGVNLHGGPRAQHFSNESVAEVHYINPRG